MKQSIHFSTCVCLILAVSTLGRAQKPEIVVQTNHFREIWAVTFSPNGKLVASSSDDKTIKLWDVETRIELRTLSGHPDGVWSIAFSPDGKLIVSGSNDKTVKLWDVETGREIKTLTGHSGPVKAVAFSPDGKLIVSGSYDNTIKLWDVKTGKELKTLAGHPRSVETVAFTPDGKRIASGSSDDTIKLWDVATGKELKTLAGHSGYVLSVAFSPNGKLLASGSEDKTIKLWDVETGREIITLTGHSTLVWSIAFSPNGKLLASGSWPDEDRRPSGTDWNGMIKLWDVATGKELRTLSGHSGWILSVAFSPDGKQIVCGSFGAAKRGINRWNVETGKELLPLSARSTPVLLGAVSPDGKLIAIGSTNHDIHLWSLRAGKEFRTLKGHSQLVNSVVFSPSGKLLASSSSDGSIKLWDVETGRVLRTMWAGEGIQSIAFSPDGTVLASGSDDNAIRLWDVETGRMLRNLTRSMFSKGVKSVIFVSNSNKLIGIGNGNNWIILWDFRGGNVIFRGHSGSIESAAFSPDGKLLASGSRDNSIKLWDVETGREIKTLTGHTGWVEAVTFSPDGKQLASGSRDNKIKLWDVASGKVLETLSGHSASVAWLAFLPDGKRIVSSSEDTKTTIWDLSAEKELVNLIAIDDNDWLVTTPDGFFDGTSAAWKQIFWRFNNNTFDYGAVELYFTDFFYPNLLQDVLAGNSPKPQAGQELEKIDRRQPKVEITSVNAQTKAWIDSQLVRQFSTDKRMIRVIIEVTDNVNRKKLPNHQQTSGAQDLRLFRNGSLVKVWRGDVFKLSSKDGCQQMAPSQANEPRRVRCQADVSVITGDNSFKAYVFNTSNIKSNDDTVTIKGADSLKRAGTLFVIAIGVGQYENPQYNLNYTVADAQSFGEEVKRRQEQVKQYERVEVISLLNDQAKKATILAALKKLADAIQPEDGVIVYFSGHGTAQGNRFYLIPHDLDYQGRRDRLDATSLQTILTHSISDRELEEAFEKIDAERILLVIDACNSGQALDAEEKRRGPMNSKGLAQLAYEKGMHVLTASQSVELAYESEALKHSYMTYALVEEGLKSKVGEADFNRDGQVWLREWFDYAVQRVPLMRASKVAQTANQSNKSLEEESERGKVQIPRVFYRREADLHPWIVAQVK
jgi:WD40 repeat protein